MLKYDGYWPQKVHVSGHPGTPGLSQVHCRLVADWAANENAPRAEGLVQRGL